tara:strand:+ start:321 stop:701 length:381 start_codon:yes stop_codon:yes gene_type:complete
MTKYTMQDRFFLFAAITMMCAYCYQFYFIHQQDKKIAETMEMYNKRTVRYVELNAVLQQKIKLLEQAVEHWKAMYQGSQTSNYQLEQQIEVISNYYKNEIIKVNDELFDLKHSDTNRTYDAITPNK